MAANFLVFEGIDGSGSSTQAQKLHQYFQNQGARSVLSPEPSHGMIGSLIRGALQQKVFFTADRQKFNEQMAYLFAADRHDHLYNDTDGVYKLLQDGFHVITTRYYFSSLAYNAHTPEEWEFVQRLNAKFPMPDLVIYFDIPVEVAIERIGKRPLQEIYEQKEYLTRVQKNYQQIFADYSGPSLILDGTAAPEAIHEKIIQTIANL